ncbi:hypothetical protein LPJ72_004704 [Coemansia sp. Benny D160-2]|nr:hypothetical protein LPJ72_004704 [Coemansia sp. Benny D160-2]
MSGKSKCNDTGEQEYLSDSSIERQLCEFDNLVSEGDIVISDTSSDAPHEEIIDLVLDEEEDKAAAAAAEPSSGNADNKEGPEFPDGTVRLTHVLGEPQDTSKYYSLTDLLQPSKLRKALLTTYVFDVEWLLMHTGLSTKLVIVKSYSPSEEQTGVYQSEDGRITFVNPVFGVQKYPVMHSKIMLLFYDDYVRFVALSANLIEIDWTVLANIMYIQDFPYKSGTQLDQNYSGSNGQNSQQHGLPFCESLKAALRDMDVPEQVVKQMDGIDMSRARVHVVTTVPTSRIRLKGKHADSYGISRLGSIAQAMRRESKVSDSEWFDTKLFCYGSSLSRLDAKYLDSFYKYVLNKTISLPGSLCMSLGYSGEEAYTSHVIHQNIAVGFHTLDQTNTNKYGAIPKSCIMFPSDAYFSSEYPSFALHKISPKVPDVLVHAKIILARHGESSGWMYLGSHNFTRGAWGTIGGGRFGGSSQYYNNYEFGIVLPDVQYKNHSAAGGRTVVVWNGAEIPVPFEPSPWTRYGEADMPSIKEMERR